MLKDTNMNALLEKSYECGSEAGMKHIGFYLDGLNLMADGKEGGINCTLKVRWKLMLKNNGNLEIVDNMEIGNE
jgi:hypothetical protein